MTAVCSKADPLVYALTGEEHARTPGDLLARLAACGWSLDRLAALRDARRSAGEGWPFTVPAHLLECGYAAFAAALVQARGELGLDGLTVPPPPSRPLNADERRLSADRPPHWG